MNAKIYPQAVLIVYDPNIPTSITEDRKSNNDI